jgi:glycosyltransferase involved in cell wall biosynthesis
MKNKIRVCLILEGTYPFVTGGVSAWVHELITGLPEIEFVLYTISPKKNLPLRYALPENIVGHKDIVISEHKKTKRLGKGKKKLLEEIEKIHGVFQSGKIPELDSAIAKMKNGYYLYRDAVASDTGWKMIAGGNARNNPVYKFSDYFWSWKAAHDMMFTIIGTRPQKADIYHAISTGYAGLAAIVGKITTGKAYLLTEHGLYHKEREIEIKRADFVRGYHKDMWVSMYNTLSKLSYNYADMVISLFEYNRRKQIEMGASEKKTIVIPNGIDVERFSSVVRQKKEGFHIGLIGRVVPIKDIKNFILASKIVSDHIPEARFYCIGPTDEDPVYYVECKALVNSFRLENSFEFTGRQDVTSYYSFLDVIVLTSVREAQPLVILEAYCAGLPIVSTRVGNVPELLDYDERFLASPKDPEKIAMCVKYIYDNPLEVEKFLERNKEKVFRFYNRIEVHKRYEEIYKFLIRTNPNSKTIAQELEINKIGEEIPK